MNQPAALYAHHLPPSAGLPRVLALDQAAASELGGLAEVTQAGAPEVIAAGAYDAVAGAAAPEQVERLGQHLRPGGRLILADSAEPERLLQALSAAGLVHCLVEPHGPLTLYRGERPPQGTSRERVQALSGSGARLGQAERSGLTMADLAALKTPFLFLLITQTPNKPTWKLAAGEHIEWRAATLLDPTSGRPALLAFTALIKAVAYMQSAILARAISGVNKVGKFPASAAPGWLVPVVVNPDFAAVQDFPPGPPLTIDPQTALTGDE